MNEYDSIKRSLSIILLIIILCFLTVFVVEIYYFLIHGFVNRSENRNLLYECLFHIFVVYFLSDLLNSINKEEGMFKSYYLPNYFKVVKVVYF